MAKRILVPLDQSPHAEAVLPLVGEVARGSGATVRLLHVASIPDNRVGPGGRVIVWAAQEMTRLEAEGKDYLRTLELQLAEVPVECVVRFGSAVEEILLEAEAFGADLIIVSTAGRGGIARAVLGSVAEQVFRKAKTPVVLFRAGSTAR